MLWKNCESVPSSLTESRCEFEGHFIIIIIIISIIARKIIQLIQLAFVAAGVMALGIFEMADSRLSFGQTSH